VLQRELVTGKRIYAVMDIHYRQFGTRKYRNCFKIQTVNICNNPVASGENVGGYNDIDSYSVICKEHIFGSKC
jgi:hypothetical protein